MGTYYVLGALPDAGDTEVEKEVRFLPIRETEPISHQVNRVGTDSIRWESHGGGDAKEGTAELSPE